MQRQAFDKGDQKWRIRLRTELLRIASIGLGFLWGATMGYPGRALPSQFFIVAAIAILALSCGLISSLYFQGWRQNETLVIAALVVYAGVIIVTDPLMESKDFVLVVRNIVLLLPFLVSVGFFARRQNGPATCGAALFLLVCVAVVTFNTRLRDF